MSLVHWLAHLFHVNRCEVTRAYDAGSGRRGRDVGYRCIRCGRFTRWEGQEW